ncbi:MAG: DUF4126 family protein [Chloroflexia bacterium]|nr:DUF4126 family protein [Chloroflexia bacterium]
MTHDSDSFPDYARSAGVGIVAGMRSQLPLALLALESSRGRFDAGSQAPLRLLGEPVARRLLGLAAAGEFVGDKLPFTPSRLDPGPLGGRFLFGGLAGAAVAAESGRAPLLGVALGAAGAGIGAAAGYQARSFLGSRTGVADPVWGAVEDIAAIALGLAVLRASRR